MYYLVCKYKSILDLTRSENGKECMIWYELTHHIMFISQIKLIFLKLITYLKISNWRMFKKIKKLRKEIVR